MSLQETITFLRDHATLEDLKTIREIFSVRLRQVQGQEAQAFRPNDRVLFVDGGVQQPALVLQVSRRFVTVCLGNHRHVRCDASFLKKIPVASAVTVSALAAHPCAAR